MEKQTHDQIYLMLGRIEGGVAGINKRLDMLNGKVDKHDDRLDDVEKKASFEKGRTMKDHSITAGISGIVAGVLTFVYTYLK
jgi:hypothetical protein